MYEKVKLLVDQLCSTLCDRMDSSVTRLLCDQAPHVTRLLCPWNSPGNNTGVGSHSLLRGSSQPRDQTWVSALQADSSLSEPPRKIRYIIQFSSVQSLSHV